ncbi:hypothetical protein FGIG_05017 [Fasciola gigantica]|uniref:Uncharacterized protein n=1 Tax=Fasciola gigantica TaxID=46835 RepID=A0A504YBM2_FASGI|nr:hypothetical protein FGIG_05017 [Fasciola gigantica]
MCYSTRSTCHSHDSDPSQCSANACSDNQSSVFTTDASSPSGNDVPTNVVTLTIPSVNIVAESFVNTVQLEPIPTLVSDRSTDQLTANPSDNEQDQYHPKMNRPSLCLFSARRRHRRGPHGVERPLSSTQLLRFSKDRLRYGELRGQYGKLLKVAPFELINSAVNLQGDSFASRQSGNRRNPLHTMNTTNPTDARSCGDLKEFERLRGFGNSYMSTDSTLSPLTAVDLPDVYLNPPSLSSLQSKRSSIMASDVPDFLNVPSATGHMSASPSFISMKEQMFAAPDQHQAVSLQRNRCSVIEISNFRWNSNEKSRLSQQNIHANYELLPEPRFTHGSRQNIYLHDISNSNLTSGSCAYEVTGESTPYRDCSRGFGTLKRAFSLNLRSKGPKTLGAELQSIMDKHYEMTGIRMVTASSRSASYLGLKNTNPSDGAWHGKTGQSKASKRRSSWSICKEETWLKRPTNMKSAISSLHLDCFHRDQMSMNKITPGKLNKSVLASLSTVALPCLVPLRSRLHSDTCSIGSSHARDITQTDLSRSEEKPMRRSSSVGLQRPSIVAGTPAELGLALMGIHRPDLEANVHYQHG